MSYQKLLSLLTRSHKNLSYDLLSHDTWATAGSYRGHESWLSDLSDPTVPNVSPALPNIRFQEYSSDYILICCLHWGWMCFQEYISLDHLSHETQDPKRTSSVFSFLVSHWNGEKNHHHHLVYMALSFWLCGNLRDLLPWVMRYSHKSWDTLMNHKITRKTRIWSLVSWDMSYQKLTQYCVTKDFKSPVLHNTPEILIWSLES